MAESINVVLILFIIITAIAAVRVRELVGAVFLLSTFSLFLSVLYALLGAVDVAFTEAMVGIGASTIFFILALFRTRHFVQKQPGKAFPWSTLLCIGALGILFLWGSMELPLFGDPQSAANSYLSPYYLQNAFKDSHTPNAVTAVVVDYRGFDTLIEATVIFTAGVACLLIMRRKL